MLYTHLWLQDRLGIAEHVACLDTLRPARAAYHLNHVAGSEIEIVVEDQNQSWFGEPEVRSSSEPCLHEEDSFIDLWCIGVHRVSILSEQNLVERDDSTMLPHHVLEAVD